MALAAHERMRERGVPGDRADDVLGQRRHGDRLRGTGHDGDVQAGALAYMDNGNGTISDVNTGLTWEKREPCVRLGLRTWVHGIDAQLHRSQFLPVVA